MDLENIQSFLEKAGDRVSRTRAGLLIFSQSGGHADDLAICSFDLEALRVEAVELGLIEVGDRLSECKISLGAIVPGDKPSSIIAVHRALDRVTGVEAALLDIPLESGEFLDDVSGFVDASFENLDRRLPKPEEDFEIDDETLEIFRSEADDLLAGISHNLNSLATTPDDRNALWEIRRNAHTFKGAAGIVGLNAASKLAHRVEDLLDKMVELQCGADQRVLELLIRSNVHLHAITTGTPADDKIAIPVDVEFASVINGISKKKALSTSVNRTNPIQEVNNGIVSAPVRSTPIVRVSLDRLDELIRVSHNLIENRSALSDRIAAVNSGATNDDFRTLEALFEIQRRLTDEMQEKLQRIRMVRFGTLETRLKRAVHVTCQEENKRAVVEIMNPDTEIDTQIIDALIEPLLHLLKNAVVHGIEPSETRRLIGKPEKGLIRISVDSDENDVILSVEDDGRGISALKLKEKAISSGIITAEAAAKLADFETWELIFDRGLTTAETLNLNAGRGIGMNIVRESVESRKGSVSLSTEPQIGTTFTIRMPLVFKKNEAVQMAERVVANERKPVVLVVDDSATVRRHNVELVEQAGCQAITAKDGAEALELLLSGKWEPDLILSDVEMPNMDGWELLEYVKSDANFGSIPVVLVTSLDAEVHLARAVELGASNYAVKPLTKEILEETLKVTVGDNYGTKL